MKKNRLGVLIITTLAILGILKRREGVMKKLADVRLGKNFTLAEMVRTYTGYENIPGDAEIENLRYLVAFGLQPLRDALGLPIVVSSGYRSPLVNAAIGGAKNSQHKKGEAVDFRVPGMSASEVVREIIRLGLPYDQLIDEKKGDSEWVHWSLTRGVNRKEFLTFRDGEYTLISRG